MYKKENIEQFHKDTLDDYNRSLIIEDIVKVDLTEKTDDSFIQIGIRPVLDDEMFVSSSFDPRLPSAGRMVAIGEEDFLINTILNKKEIKKIEIKENIEEFPKYVYEFNDPIILISNKFFVEIFTKLMHRIDYEERYPRLDNRYKIIIVPETILTNKIIITPITPNSTKNNNPTLCTG